MPQRIFLDTDIGTDIDDAYAVVLAAASPEIELMGVSTVNNDTARRARIARTLLNLLDRRDVPVATGRSDALSPGITLGWGGHEGEGIDLADADTASDTLTAQALFSSCLSQCESDGESLVLVTIGALTNAADFLDRLPPEKLRAVSRIVAMASTLEGFGENAASREHNVACDPLAFKRVIESGIPVTLVGLNVTRRTTMTEQHLCEIEAIGGPLAAALSGMHRVWFRVIGRDNSAMHDALAVAAVFRSDLLNTTPVEAEVRGTEGVVIYNSPADGKVTTVEIATDIQLEGFQKLFWERVTGAVRAGRAREDGFPTDEAGRQARR